MSGWEDRPNSVMDRCTMLWTSSHAERWSTRPPSDSFQRLIGWCCLVMTSLSYSRTHLNDSWWCIHWSSTRATCAGLFTGTRPISVQYIKSRQIIKKRKHKSLVHLRFGFQNMLEQNFFSKVSETFRNLPLHYFQCPITVPKVGHSSPSGLRLYYSIKPNGDRNHAWTLRRMDI